MTELERYKKVLTSVLAYISGYGESEKLVNEIRDILYPAPIMESVEEIVGWVNVYQDSNGKLFTSPVYPNEFDAHTLKEGNRISCQPIKVTVMREKKVPVERSLSGEVRWEMDDKRLFVPYLTNPTFSFRDLKDKTGMLTFTWTEEPTT